MLLALGYAGLVGHGTQAARNRLLLDGLAAIYGSATALALDEFAMWLHLGEKYKTRSDYWDREGRKSIWAVWAFALLLGLTLLGRLASDGFHRR